MITLQFVLGRDFSSRLIAWYGQGYNGFSHVDAVMPDGSLLGARSDEPGGTKSGVQVRPADYEKWVRQERLSLQVSMAQEAAWERFLRSQVGLPYDMPAIWGFILGREQHANGHWICSALQTGALESIGVLPTGFGAKIASAQVAPNSLHLLMLGLGATTSV